jgi:hypothetical protein
MGFKEWGRALAVAAALSASEGPQPSAGAEKPAAKETINSKGEKVTKECGPDDACVVHVEKRTDRDGIVLYMNELISRVKKEKLASKSNSEDWEYFKDQFQEESQEIRKLNPQLFDNDNDLKDLESQLHTLFNS